MEGDMETPARFLFGFCFLLLGLTGPSKAMDKVKATNIVFPVERHSVSLKDSIKRNHPVRYRDTRTMMIAESMSGAARKPGFAADDSSGPDYWQVSGLKPKDSLKMREGPAADKDVILAFSEGTVLRNRGCEDHLGRRWCRVESPEDSNVTGWVEGRYLRESFNPPPLRDALVPGTHHHATGNVQCRHTADAPVSSCRFGVVRSDSGTVVVDITFPDGFERTLYFSKGRVEAEIGVIATTLHENDNTIVTIGENERYVIPGVILEGD